MNCAVRSLQRELRAVKQEIAIIKQHSVSLGPDGLAKLENEAVLLEELILSLSKD